MDRSPAKPRPATFGWNRLFTRNRRRATPSPADVLVLAVSLAVILIVPGCSKDSGPPTSSLNPTAAQDKVDLANAALERILYDQINGSDPSRPSDLDFTQPYGLYTEALALDDGNLDAHFGAAVTGLLALSADTEVNAAFDEWKTYLQHRVPFQAGSSPGSPLGVSLGFPSGPRALALPFDLVPLTLVAQVRSSMLPADPQIDRIQAILQDRVIPRLTAARSHLARSAQNPLYRFLVSGRMQGDNQAPSVEIDRTDLLALLSGCDLLSGLCRIGVSYRLGMAAYDSLNLAQAFEPGSGWMALRPGGAEQMRQAHTDLLQAVDDLDSAITSLLAETDPQDDDVIRLGPEGIRRDDAEKLQANLPEVRTAMTDGLVREEDWDGDSSTPNTSLRIEVGRLLTDPVTDWKALLPSYSVRVERRPLNTDWSYSSTTVINTLDIPYSGDLDISYSVRIQVDGTNDIHQSGPEPLRSMLRTMVEDALARIRDNPQWAGECNVYASLYGTATEGRQVVRIYLTESYSLVGTSVVIPILTWQAEDFSHWVWPDPTLHGLLPEMASSGQLLSTFGFGPDNWHREIALDWTGGGNHSVPTVPPQMIAGGIMAAVSLSPGAPGDVSGAQVLIYLRPEDLTNHRPARFIVLGGSGSVLHGYWGHLSPRDYYIAAWKDVNGNGTVDRGDLYGLYSMNDWPPPEPMAIAVQDGQVSNVTVTLFPVP